jgi:hypothetical protein
MDDKITEIQTGGLPRELAPGDIWGTKRSGIFVVVSSRPAQWHGEDRDVYGHIATWYRVRPADASETTLWQSAVDATTTRRKQREQLGVGRDWIFNAETSTINPPTASTRRLDSYDDRWEPPVAKQLTPEEAIVERKYIKTMAARRGRPLDPGSGSVAKLPEPPKDTPPTPLHKVVEKPETKALPTSVPKGLPEHTLGGLKHIESERSPRAQARDQSQSHQLTVLPTDTKHVRIWRQHPGRLDILGVDTPPSVTKPTHPQGLRMIRPPAPSKRHAKPKSDSVRFGKQFYTRVGNHTAVSRRPLKRQGRKR